VCVCLSVRSQYLENHTAELQQIFVHVVYGRDSVAISYALPVFVDDVAWTLSWRVMRMRKLDNRST